MAAIQGPSGDMDALQRAYSCRSLLPAEQQIIDALGLTVDEYWEFCRLADCAAKERDGAYELVPDVVAATGGTLEAYLINIAIGITLTAASTLLAPKPQAPEEAPEAIKTEDLRGQTRFAELYGFDSLQDLATLGSIIPLVFARQKVDPANSNKVIGGIRVKGMLLWSQLISQGSHQELRMLTTLGLSQIGDPGLPPDAAGLAIGDQLLRTYQEPKFAAYFKNNEPSGGRVTNTNLLSGSLAELPYEDVFLAFDREPSVNNFSPMLSGTRTPGSQRAFGVHSPISNGAPYFFPYDLVQVFDDEESHISKRNKINGPQGIGHSRPYSSRQGMFFLHRVGPGSDGSSYNAITSGADNLRIRPGDRLQFRSSELREDPESFSPHGLDDVNTAIDNRISQADSLINVGDLFSFGSSIITCTARPPRPFDKTNLRNLDYEFVCEEEGFGYFVDPDNDPFQVGNAPFGAHLQRIEIACVTNNRKCNQTEIGIKSEVFKRVEGFANVQSEPPKSILEEYEKDKQSFRLGRVSTFQTRYSFFRIFVREVGGSVASFRDISAGQVFAVKGDNPQPQYNTIRINHAEGQFEFRLVPVAGTFANGLYVNKAGQSNNVQLLQGTGRATVDVNNNEFIISYTGFPARITESKASNDEFKFKRVEQGTTVSGKVLAFDQESIGELPDGADWELVEGPEVDYDFVNNHLRTGVLVNVDNPGDIGAVYAAWRGTVLDTESNEFGSEFQYKLSDLVQQIPAETRFITEVPGRLVRTSGTNDFYVELNPNGTLLSAFYDNNNVTLQTQDPTLPDDVTKLYRVGTDGVSESVQIPAGIADGPEGAQYDPITAGFYYGVWERRADGIRTGLWNGQVVPLKDESTLTASDFVDNIAYVIGTFQVFNADINCDVYSIKRKFYTPPGTTRYFRSIEKVSTETIRVARNLYKIGLYKFDSDSFPIIDGPDIYTPVNAGDLDGSGLKISASSLNEGHWTWRIVDPGSGYTQDKRVVFEFPDSDDPEVEVSLNITELGSEVIDPEERALNVKDAIADFPKYEQEKTSHQDGPEHSVVFVNEMIRPDKRKPNQGAAQYNDLSLLGLRLQAGKDWTSMGQLSAYVKQGIQVDRLITDTGASSSKDALKASTNNFAEIAYNLLVSERLGAGKRIPESTVDRDAMTIAAKFCRANNFTFDGIIENKTSVREFIFANAAFSLLNFTVIGGKFSLTPAVPYNPSDFRIDPAKKIADNIKALFTDGNMKDMQVSFLPAQDRQPTKITVAYREEKENGFASQKIIQVRLNNDSGGSIDDPEEYIDMTKFCTRSDHAQAIAKYKLLTRKHSDHSISFKTTPSSALTIAPGDFIKVVSKTTHTSRFNNGSIDQHGGITSTTPINNSDGTPVFYWKPGRAEVEEDTLSVTDNKTGDPEFFGSIFTVRMQNQEKRVYRVTSITIDDEGFVDISASHEPLTRNGTLATINPDPTQFTVTGG
jgi:hypothetical protein|tara:strand:- start:300 stop:4685 length:4386 start_codon:yes stop_codon:yes gene_type:complete